MAALQPHVLDGSDQVFVTRLPVDLMAADDAFDTLWDLHPEAFHIMRGRFPTPRWQQAYGHDYRYSGSVNRAQATPPEFESYLEWVQEEIDARLNGVLVNWYELSEGHYIGAHRDSPTGLLVDAPIVTMSLGVTRTFRMRRRSKRVDIEVDHGKVIVMPAEVNRRWDHQVPRVKGQGRRISITVRAFEA